MLIPKDPGATLTLSGQALGGVAITGQVVTLGGDLVLDVSGYDVRDGTTFTHQRHIDHWHLELR
jgi:hypothetical protein